MERNTWNIRYKNLEMETSCNKLLIDACKEGNLQNVKLAISQGADIHAENDRAVRLASYNGHLAVVKYLVSQSADIHADNDGAVRWAMENGHLDVVQYLVSQGADIHANADDAVLWASECGYLDVVAYLVSQGAPIPPNISKFQCNYISIYLKHYKCREIRATSRIYFWWIRRCYEMSRGSGIRMCLASLAEYETLCA